MKNLAAKMRNVDSPYEVWTNQPSTWDQLTKVAKLTIPEACKRAAMVSGAWTWVVLKKWQANDDKNFGRWFCKVFSPIVPEGEMGDVYVDDVREAARRVFIHEDFNDKN